MNTYLAYGRGYYVDHEIRFYADSMSQARNIAKLNNWVLLGEFVEEMPADTKAMYERWLNDETLH